MVDVKPTVCVYGRVRGVLAGKRGDANMPQAVLASIAEQGCEVVRIDEIHTNPPDASDKAPKHQTWDPNVYQRHLSEKYRAMLIDRLWQLNDANALFVAIDVLPSSHTEAVIMCAWARRIPIITYAYDAGIPLSPVYALGYVANSIHAASASDAVIETVDRAKQHLREGVAG